MEFSNTVPEWDAVGTEPSEDIKKNGFSAGYKPPAAYFNYLFNRYTACIKELQHILAEIGDVSGNTITSLENGLLGYYGGKNLLDYKTFNYHEKYGTNCILQTDHSIKVSNYGTTQITPQTYSFYAEAGTYTVSISGVTFTKGSTFDWHVARNNVALERRTVKGESDSYTFTLTERGTVRITLYVPASTVFTAFFQMERGESVTEFEKHTETLPDVTRQLRLDVDALEEQHLLVDALPTSPDSDTFYYIPE